MDWQEALKWFEKPSAWIQEGQEVQALRAMARQIEDNRLAIEGLQKELLGVMDAKRAQAYLAQLNSL